MPAGLANVKLGWKVADFIAENASKEDSETLGPDARGFRRFRVLASAREKSLDDVVVYFRENQVMLIAATATRPIDDAGSWSRFVAEIAAEFGAGDTEAIPADRPKMLQSFSLGEKGKALKLREFVAWETPTAEIAALWLEDAWAKKRTYVLTLSRTATSAEPLMSPRESLELTGLFIAEKMFFGEYNSYSTDLFSANFLPEPGGVWVYGFCNEFPVGEIAGIRGHDGKRSHTLHPAVVKDAGDKERLAALADPCAKLKALGLADRFQVTPHGFTGFAIANLDADGDLEVWSIDQRKNLERVRSDSP